MNQKQVNPPPTYGRPPAPPGPLVVCECKEKNARIHAALAVLEDTAGGSLEERHKVASMLLRVALRGAA